jgi:Leu/Phe-tRNA-protein transferase
MSGRAARLDRLLAIRRLSEDLDRRSLGLALAAVSEVEAGIGRQETALAESELAGRKALSSGERGDWLMADRQTEVAGWTRRRLKVLLRARTVKVAASMEKFMESRREHLQVKQLVENAQKVMAIEEGRTAQAAADYWYLSKRTRSKD